MSQLVAKNASLMLYRGKYLLLRQTSRQPSKAIDQVRESEARVTRFEKAADAVFDGVVVQQYREQAQNPASNSRLSSVIISAS